MFSKILVAAEGSQGSDKALEIAADLSKQYGAELHAAYALNYEHYLMGLGVGATMTISHEELEQGAQNLLQGTTEKLAKLDCKPTQTHILSGDAGKTIADLAKSIGADLIVVGSKGHSNISGLLLGSVSQKISHLAHCSCLIAR